MMAIPRPWMSLARTELMSRVAVMAAAAVAMAEVEAMAEAEAMAAADAVEEGAMAVVMEGVMVEAAVRKAEAVERWDVSMVGIWEAVWLIGADLLAIVTALKWKGLEEVIGRNARRKEGNKVWFQKSLCNKRKGVCLLF